MIYFPHAKINIGLHITAKRTDGFHTISSLCYPIPFHDILEILPAQKTTIRLTGHPLDGNPEDNLCLKAYHILQKAYNLPPIEIHLHKTIPPGGGLGGGSSDASHTLLALNQIFTLQIPQQQLMRYAAQTGSDCPFFIQQQPALIQGRGEIIHPSNISLKGYYLLLAKPPISISTAQAYAHITPQQPPQPLPQLLQLPVSSWHKHIFNNFEPTIFTRHPELAALKTHLYNKGAIYTAMSGSGATIFALFDHPKKTQQARETTPYTILTIKIN